MDQREYPLGAPVRHALGLGQAAKKFCFVSGHDFSRVVND
jgi:hypothetical protein